MGKGASTRKSILRRALELSSEVGLEGLTVGALAKRAGMSKSGLYAHFQSKETLQCQVLDTAAERFVDVVMAPALKEPRGVPRLEKLFDLWLVWETESLSGGCLFIAAASEFDDRPGPVRDRLVAHLRDILGAVGRAARIAVEEGHLAEGLDDEQFAYEFWAFLLAHHLNGKLMGDAQSAARAKKGFWSLIERSRPLPG